ncbi:MAG: hypothetical protein ORO03_05365 [Alphaproteobacteria bacterium]|nr:hypothetical protein [Alphaproteobacteria bacterium]
MSTAMNNRFSLFALSLLASTALAGLAMAAETPPQGIHIPGQTIDTQPDGLGTIVGNPEPEPSPISFSGNMAIFASRMRYKESVNNGTFVEHSGELSGGGEFNWRMAFQNFELGTDLNLKGGTAKYSSGSGVSPNESTQVIEPRLIFGYRAGFNDWNDNPVTILPYTGVGYRHYFNDARSPLYSGNRLPNYGGYRRKTEYFYMPFGVTVGGLLGQLTPSPKASHTEDTNEFWLNRITWKVNLEYDLLLSATNRSYLADIYGCYSGDNCPAGINPGDLTIENQNDIGSGYGIKSFIEIGYNNVSIGPYLDYWNINRYPSVSRDFSQYPEIVNQKGESTAFFEPANTTTEFGFRIRLSF